MNYLFQILITTTLLLGSQPAATQQPLNLDFERISTEGAHRPWGWAYYWQSPHTEAALDSAMPYTGKYSFRFSGKGKPEETSPHTLGHWIDPWALKGKQLQLKGWVKTEALTGEAQITLSAWGEAGTLNADTVTIRHTGLQQSAPWAPFNLEIKVDTPSYSVGITVGLDGTGNVWFDAFTLMADGVPLEEVAVASAFSDSQMEWLFHQTAPLEAIALPPPGELPDFPGLAAFQRIAGDARLIALGESTHGTSEFFRIKHQLLEYAIRKMGVTVFAIEANQLDVEQVNRYVLHGEGDARTVMKVMFKVWNTEEMLALIEWMRAYNLEHPQNKIEFVGFDMQDPQLPIDSILAFLPEYAPELLPVIDSLLRPYREAWRQQYYPAGSDSVRQNWSDNAEQAWRLVSAQRENWLRRALGPAEKKRVEWALQNARLIRQAARTALAQDIVSRDEAMAENISWLLDQRPPGTRMIIWAHDGHISRGEAPDPLYNYFLGGSMGAHLAKKFGDNYRAFGLSTYDGTYSATLSFGSRDMVPVRAFPSPVGSLDEALHRIAAQQGAPGVLLGLRPGRDEHWLTEPRPVRFIGYMSSDYSYETKIAIPFQFDGLIFIDETSYSKVMD
ncbi:MAG: erythromycin esterase family protein [Phaeodactylibacter sp.]|nr:erythromycin esterase family protein [Phaeodactylibacter sp.]MCB9054162.1 erythromycin esterase family protein [Lewinellaceae bacterium]